MKENELCEQKEGCEGRKESNEVGGSRWKLDYNHRDLFAFWASFSKLANKKEFIRDGMKQCAASEYLGIVLSINEIHKS